MKRQTAILLITHGYPLFMSINLYFFSDTRLFQVLSNIAPFIFFISMFLIWYNTSHIRLTKSEKFYLGYLIFNLIFVYCFYCLCIFSSPKWIYDRNWQVSLFILVTLIFYIFNYRDRK